MAKVLLLIDGEIASRLANIDIAQNIANTYVRAGHEVSITEDDGTVLFHAHPVNQDTSLVEAPRGWKEGA